MSTTSSLVPSIVHFLVHRIMDPGCLLFVPIIASAYSKLPICHVLELETPPSSIPKATQSPDSLALPTLP